MIIKLLTVLLLLVLVPENLLPWGTAFVTTSYPVTKITVYNQKKDMDTYYCRIEIKNLITGQINEGTLSQWKWNDDQSSMDIFDTYINFNPGTYQWMVKSDGFSEYSTCFAEWIGDDYYANVQNGLVFNVYKTNLPLVKNE